MDSTLGDVPKYNFPLDKWDTSSVTTMYGLFSCYRYVDGHCGFNQDISSWDTGLVKDMASMFENTLFNQDISGWNTSSVEEMRLMFISAPDFNQNLCRWGELLPNTAQASEAFIETACPVTDSPNLTATPPGPLCHPCA